MENQEFTFEVNDYTGAVNNPEAVKELTDIIKSFPDPTKIPYKAFYDCRSLTQITIPDSVVSFEEEAFGNCSSLTQITFANPSSLNNIDDSVFYNCNNLTQIVIPSSVKNIGFYVFSDCSSLNQITLPASFLADGKNILRHQLDLSSKVEIKTLTPSLVASFPDAIKKSAETNVPSQDQKPQDKGCCIIY